MKFAKVALKRYWGIAALLVFWQVGVTWSGLNSIVLPPPTAVVADIVSNPTIYVENSVYTLELALVGLLLGTVFGTAMAVGAWSSRVLRGMFLPLALFLSSIPVVAIIPVIARLLGYNILTVGAVVVIISFFPAFIFTSTGLKAAPAGSGDLFKVLGAGRWSRFAALALPSSVPSWMTGLRIAAPPAVLAAMLGEYLIGKDGLGYLFRSAAADFNVERALGVSVLATIVSVLSFGAARAAEEIVSERFR
ncbi:NitT/TauT family transport system permease protein [Rhizobium sp. BK313]|uniref:ABC transporter permease n=1 Tax=Rhizobium sp. BK313 TaxID=2587081 RepID=UPI00182C31C0|nr:ABC transporter permease subunit [Rhizobium sp. BK313]MBB3458309.1 NitT/TauT family transport system permease protein [Rhizobium sp. BK313]